jgi:hypothetical protein
LGFWGFGVLGFWQKCEFIFWLYNSPITDWIYRKFPKKQLNAFSTQLPINEIQRLFESLILGDGHIRKKDGRICFTQKETSTDTRNFFQILCLKLGYNCLGVKDLHLNKRHTTWIRNSSGEMLSDEYFSGYIYCPYIKNDGWICRSGINVFITGSGKVRKLPKNHQPSLEQNIEESQKRLLSVQTPAIIPASTFKVEPESQGFIDKIEEYKEKSKDIRVGQYET